MEYQFRTVDAWPALHPPSLTRLLHERSPLDPGSEPASKRYNAHSRPNLQEEIDQLEIEEEKWLESLQDTRSFGFSWLVPLGRQNTQEEDAESSFTASPRAPSVGMDAEHGHEDGDAEEDQEVEGGRDLDAEIEDADVTGSDSLGSELLNNGNEDIEIRSDDENEAQSDPESETTRSAADSDGTEGST